MSEMAVVGAFVVGGLLIGWLLSRRYYSESRALESLVRIPMNLTWILIGGFMMLGGYTTTGLLILVIGSYFAFSNARRIDESDVETNVGGWRRRAANWTPNNRSK